MSRAPSGTEIVHMALANWHRPGSAHRMVFVYLVLQALSVMLWWPKFDFPQALEMHDGPDPLLALFLTLALTGAYFSLCWGAEELGFPGGARLARVGADRAPGPVPRVGPHAARAFMDAEAPRLSRSGFAVAIVSEQLAYSLYACLLAAPLALAALAVGGGSWYTLAWGIAIVVVFWFAYRWLGLAIRLLLGPDRPELFLALRAVFGLLTLVAVFGLPDASVVRVGFSLFGDFAGSGSAVGAGHGEGLGRVWTFIVVHGLAAGVLVIFVHRRLVSGAAEDLEPETAQPPGRRPGRQADVAWDGGSSAHSGSGGPAPR